jgi:hypothetical protein
MYCPIKALISYFETKDVMEIGGGRWPSLSDDEVSELDIRLAVNDISHL